MRFVPLVLVVALLLSGCIRIVADDPVVPAPAPRPNNQSQLPAEFGNGTFTAGVDVQSGTYLAEAVQPNCSWVTGVDGVPNNSGSGDLVLETGETVEVSGCSIFVKAG